jgi:phage tail sheath protein FI
MAINSDTLLNLPGVKIREVQLVGPPIAGVGTSTPGFVGLAPTTADKPDRFKGVPRLVTSSDQFIRDYINKIAKGTGTSYTTTAAGFAVGTTSIPLVTGSGTVVAGDLVTFAGDTNEYVVKTGVTAPGTIVLNAPGLLKAIPTSTTAMTIGDIVPNQPEATLSTPLSNAVLGYFQNGGGPCYVVNIGASGSVTDGIAALERVDVQIIAAPGNADPTTYQALIDQAKNMKDRFAILDAPTKASLGGTFDKLKKTASAGGARPNDTIWAAFYYPQIEVLPLLKDDKGPIYVAPTGHIAGVYAQVDALRGVHKAPANEVLSGALGVEDVLNDEDQDPLNAVGVNIVRLFPSGPTLWGARTLAPAADPTFRYISTRRLVTYVEQSLKVGLRFAVFEPNNLALRQKITRSVRGFLDGVWRDGALFGATADEAYYVRFPDVFNTDDDRALGKLTLEVGLRVTFPAEFIIVRIGLLLQNASTA